MEKYRHLRDRVRRSRECRNAELLVPPPASDDQLRRVHRYDYLRKVVEGRLTPPEVRRLGFPWSPELVERSRQSVGGTIEAGASALREGLSVNLAGGTHHAFPGRGEGFCVFNDVAVAVRELRARGTLKRAAVVDLDVHQGNGTADIFRNDPATFTLSVHGDRNFPFQKEPSDLDLPLPDGAGDEAFLEAVRHGVETILERPKPDLVFYLAGADAFRDDRLGRLNVSRAGLAEKDEIVLGSFHDRGIPVAIVMAGGYAREVADTVAIHLNSVETAARLMREKRMALDRSPVGLRRDPQSREGRIGGDVESAIPRRMARAERSRRVDPSLRHPLRPPHA